MLALAYTFKDKLQEKYQSIIFQDKYKYWNYNNSWGFELEINNNNESDISMVSIDKNKEILGFFYAGISRSDNMVTTLSIINFSNKDNIIFAKDLYKFIIDLFYKFNFRKIDFLVVRGNPIEKMYDKYVKKYGGRIVGIRKQETTLQDNKLYDIKLYEIFQDDFKCHFKNKR